MANDLDVLPTSVVSNLALRQICEQKPTTLNQLKECRIHDFNESKYVRFGPMILDCILKFQSSLKTPEADCKTAASPTFRQDHKNYWELLHNKNGDEAFDSLHSSNLNENQLPSIDKSELHVDNSATELDLFLADIKNFTANTFVNESISKNCLPVSISTGSNTVSSNCSQVTAKLNKSSHNIKQKVLVYEYMNSSEDSSEEM